VPRSPWSPSQVPVVAQIRQLCCLGLAREAIAPALTRQLLRLIPNCSASLFFIDENCELINIYDENPALTEIAPLYVNEFYNSRETWIDLKEAFRSGLVGMTLDQILKVDKSTWEQSDMYNLIIRPLGYENSLRLAVRERGRPVGVVVISRRAGEPEFAPHHLGLLVALEPYLAHAFTGVGNAVPLVDSDADEDEGLIMTDRNGRVHHLSLHARTLLFYATHDEIAPGKLRPPRKLELPPPVSQLARMLADVFEGRAPPAPPFHHHKNRWGQFVFRAHRLEGEASAASLVGIRISRREPLPVRLLRRMERLPLSERQIEVSIHLASGESYGAVAKRLGLSRSTVIYHAQEAFNKLGVASRAELQAKLMVL
jgi:DNA-binding CsgD family transcriptional regulator